MPKIYKRKCNQCGKYYEKQNKEFCSKECFSKSGKNGIFKKGHKFIKGGEKGWFKKGTTPKNKGTGKIKIFKYHKWKDRDDYKKYRKEYKENLNAQRRANKRKAGGSHTLKEWEILKAQYNWTCPCCKNSEPSIILTRDHIIPLSRGGSHNIENIQPLCKSCNSRKNNKTIKF